MRRAIGPVLLVAMAATGVLWALARESLLASFIEAAEQDLQAVVGIVAYEHERVATAGGVRAAPIDAVLAGGAPFVAAMRRAGGGRVSSIYFFDGSGRVRDPSEQAAPGLPVPGIVGQALARLAGGERASGGTAGEPYRDREGDPVLGAWRWIPALGLGVVAERGYEIPARPLAWIDGIFAAVLGVLVLVAMLAGLPSLGEVLAAFRRPDIRQCGPYRIERLIGEGAMSNVYRARHLHLGRVVALKRLKIQAQSDELSARFDREARLASQLSHPNIVAVLDHGRVPEGGFYYTMEFINGITLTAWVEEHGPLPPARAVRVLRQICAAVGAMHAAGFLHRDIKPDNVMAYAANGDFDLVKLLDFGLIKHVDASQTRELTRNVRAIGTPAFMAPERLSDPRSVDPRTDLYGIGCIAFYLLAGRRPFEATLDTDLAQQILHVEAPRLTALSPFPIPEALADLVAATLAKDAASRPPSAAALEAALAEIATALPWRIELARLWWQSARPASDGPETVTTGTSQG